MTTRSLNERLAELNINGLGSKRAKVKAISTLAYVVGAGPETHEADVAFGLWLEEMSLMNEEKLLATLANRINSLDEEIITGDFLTQERPIQWMYVSNTALSLIEAFGGFGKAGILIQNVCQNASIKA